MNRKPEQKEYVQSLEDALRKRNLEVKTLKARVDVLECERQELATVMLPLLKKVLEATMLNDILSKMMRGTALDVEPILYRLGRMAEGGEPDGDYIHSDKE